MTINCLHKIKESLNQMRGDLHYIFLNYFVCNIPCWALRRLFYCMYGMKIGKGARIHMKCLILAPDRIIIGARTIINERCFIDGRGGLEIGSDVSVSVYSKLITGSHGVHSKTMAYESFPMKIGKNVWICTGATIISKAVIEDYAVICAGCVFKGQAEKNGIYAGNPARLLKERGITEPYMQTYKPFFR